MLLVLGLVALAPSLAGQSRRLAFRPSGMDEVTRQRDLAYRAVPRTAANRDYGDSLRYDVYRPVRGAALPGLILIHGGIVPSRPDSGPHPASALPKEWPVFEEWGRAAAASGFVGITFNHRMSTRDNVDEATEDVRLLLARVRADAGRYGLDPDRMCVAIFSAGGPLANLFFRPDGVRVRCVVLWYPFMDLGHLAVFSPFRGPHSPARLDSLAAYDPSRYLLTRPDSLPPIFLARAGRDAIPGINASIDRFLQLALLRNVRLDLYTHPSGPHGFDMVAEPDPRAAEIVEQALEFARRAAAPGRQGTATP